MVLLLTGLLGLVLGEQRFLGILNIDILEDVVHLATGGLLAYASLVRDVGLARTLVGASRVRVNQAIAFFKRSGWISVGADHRIAVHDPEALGRRAR